jgi:hypothetical protein
MAYDDVKRYTELGDTFKEDILLRSQSIHPWNKNTYSNKGRMKMSEPCDKQNVK